MTDPQTTTPTLSRTPFPLLRAAMLAAGLLIAASIAAPASAEDFVGTWAADIANCRTPQSSPDAPLILSSKGYDQHEAHCAFQGLKSTAAGEWSGTAACSVEGDRQSIAVDLTVSGDTLTLTEDGAARDLLRCR